MLENFDISLPVLSLTGGLVLFLMALRTVLADDTAHAAPPAPPPGYARNRAISPLAFPIIVTPYGLAAVIVFISLSKGNAEATALIAMIVATTLAVDWVAMIYAGAILAHFGTGLQILAIMLGVVQTALGLQIIVRSLEVLGLAGGMAR